MDPFGTQDRAQRKGASPMLEKIDLTRELSKGEYKAVKPGLQRRLYDLQKACWDAQIPSIIVFEGWDAAGKGTA
ncbi:MAG: hypothetical protein ACK2UY_04130, partial [Anaerolineae bacterium]